MFKESTERWKEIAREYEREADELVSQMQAVDEAMRRIDAETIAKEPQPSTTDKVGKSVGDLITDTHTEDGIPKSGSAKWGI